MIKIDIGEDFSPTPYGRYPSDGKYSAEKFREQLLVPALQDALSSEEVVIIYMDNVDPNFEYTSSFLEEVFGGLVRCSDFSAEDVENRIKIETHDTHLWPELQFYIRNASS